MSNAISFTIASYLTFRLAQILARASASAELVDFFAVVVLFPFVAVLLVGVVSALVCFFSEVSNVVFLALVFDVVVFFLPIDVVSDVILGVLVVKSLKLVVVETSTVLVVKSLEVVVVETSTELSMATISTELDVVGVVRGEDDDEATRIFPLTAVVCVVACPELEVEVVGAIELKEDEVETGTDVEDDDVVRITELKDELLGDWIVTLVPAE